MAASAGSMALYILLGVLLLFMIRRLVPGAAGIVLWVLCIYIAIQYLGQKSAKLTNTVTDARTMTTIQADSLAPLDSALPATNFAYSIWIYVDDWTYRSNETKIVMARTSSTKFGGSGGVQSILPCPVLALDAGGESTLVVAQTCVGTASAGGKVTNPVFTARIPDVPIQKWTQITVSVDNRTMDVYLDGKLVKSSLMPGIALVDDAANVYITPAGGFSGWTNRLEYTPHALNPQEVWDSYAAGESVWSNMWNKFGLQVLFTNNGSSQTIVSI